MVSSDDIMFSDAREFVYSMLRHDLRISPS